MTRIKLIGESTITRYKVYKIQQLSENILPKDEVFYWLAPRLDCELFGFSSTEMASSFTRNIAGVRNDQTLFELTA